MSLFVFALKQLPFILNTSPSSFFLVLELPCRLDSETKGRVFLIQIYYRTTSYQFIFCLSFYLSFDYIAYISLLMEQQPSGCAAGFPI